MYVLSVLLMTYSSFGGAFGTSIGWVFITVVCLFVVYNIIMVLRFALRVIYYTGKKYYVRHQRARDRKNGKDKKDVQTQVDENGNEIKQMDDELGDYETREIDV